MGVSPLELLHFSEVNHPFPRTMELETTVFILKNCYKNVKISKFFVRHFEMKISDTKNIFVERRFDVIVISFTSSNGKCLPVRDYTCIYNRSCDIIRLSMWQNRWETNKVNKLSWR